MKFRNILAAAATVTIGAFATTPSFAADAESTTALNVRSGPGTGYRVVDTLYQGEPVDINRCSGGWCQIEHAGPDGWVSSRYLAFYNDGRRQGGGNSGGNNSSNPDIGFCVDAPNFSFGINCDDNDGVTIGRRAQGQVCFYEHVNYRGASFCARPGERDRRLNGFWNDRISSIRVQGNASAVVCEDFGFNGRCARVDSNIRRLGGRNNDVISSYRVTR